MYRPQPLFSRYRLIWATLVFLFVGATILTVWLMTPAPVSPDDIKTAQSKNPPPQTLEERAAPVNIDLENVEVVLSSSDGSLKMQLWAKKARRDNGALMIIQGALQFEMENRNTMLVMISDGIYSQDDKEAKVNGVLRGKIEESQQYFEASELTWDISGTEIKTQDVNYYSPTIEVTGGCMCLDLKTGEIIFEKTVDAAI